MREKILISACLAGELCRYDAQIAANPELLALLASIDYGYVTVCPEVLGGLPTPRPAAEIKGGSGRDVLNGDCAIFDENGRDVTKNFVTGAKKALKISLDNNITKAVLNERSPSCGVRYIYKGESLVEGAGVLAALLVDNGIEVSSDEDFLKDHKK